MTFFSPMRGYIPLLLIFGVGVFSALFHGAPLVTGRLWHIVYSDIFSFFKLAVAPGIPYLDKPINYPVLTGIFMELAGFLGGGTRNGYYFATAVLLIICAAGATMFLMRTAGEADDMRVRLLRFWVFAPSMAFFLVYNWDMLVLLFVAAAFYFTSRGKYYYAAFFLALGASSKLFPALYLIPLLVQVKNRKDAVLVLSVFLGASLAVNGFFILENFDGWMYFFRFFQNHWPVPDSIWTLIRVALRPGSVFAINAASFSLFLGFYGAFLWKFRREHFLFLCFGATLLFLATNKVLSPQYFLWLLPFFIFFPVRKPWFYILEFSNLAVLFFLLWWRFQNPSPFFFAAMSMFVVVRHGTLIFLIWQIFRNAALRISFLPMHRELASIR